MNHLLLPAFPVRHVLRATTLPKSPRGFHVAIITRCLIALLFASGCVSTPAYEQVSSAAEVEREAHRRTHAVLLEKEAKLAAMELERPTPGANQAEAPKAVALACPESREKELATALKARDAELALEKRRSRELDREKSALARTVAEKEAQLRGLREKGAEDADESSPKVAREAEGEQPEDQASRADEEEESEAPFAPDLTAPDPLPGERASVGSN